MKRQMTNLLILSDFAKKQKVNDVFSPEGIVRRLQKVPQPEQLSPEWFELRNNMITASSAASLLPKTRELFKAYIESYELSDSWTDEPKKWANPYSDKTDYILQKCGHKKFEGNEATFFGQKYEQVAANFYSRYTNSEVLEFGLIQHPRYSFLGASPDGITTSGVMLEIKCPFRRIITGIPPLYYWVQVQLQLETCNLEICDFLECKISEYFSSEDYWRDNSAIPKGIIIQLPDETKKYIYPPPSISGKVDHQLWLETVVIPEDAKLIYWKLDHFNITRIYRDRDWFQRALPHLRSGFNEILKYRETGIDSLIQEQESRKRKPTAPKQPTRPQINLMEDSD